MSADMADGILAILDNWGVMDLTKLKWYILCTYWNVSDKYRDVIALPTR